jgi:hypothetical protein
MDLRKARALSKVKKKASMKEVRVSCESLFMGWLISFASKP